MRARRLDLKMKKSILRILVWLRKHTRNTKLCRWQEKKIAAMDGGFHYSKVIRELYKELHGLTIGYGTYGGCWNNSAMWWNDVEIGNYCSFAGQVAMFPCNHPMDLFTTHPITYDKWCAGANGKCPPPQRPFASNRAWSMVWKRSKYLKWL